MKNEQVKNIMPVFGFINIARVITLLSLVPPIFIPVYHHGEPMRLFLYFIVGVGLIASILWFKTAQKALTKVFIFFIMLWFLLNIVAIIFSLTN